MNKRLLFLPLISCALLTSCAGEDANEAIEVPKVTGGRSITFEVEPLSVETKSLSTKVNVVPTPTSDGLEWTNEEVSFLFYENENKQFESTFTVTKDFLGAISMIGYRPATEGNYRVIALSPKGDYFKDASFNSTIEIQQSQTQNGRTYGHLTDCVYLYSHTNTLLDIDEKGDVVNGNFPLQFNPLNSLVRFDIFNESTKRVMLNSIKIHLGGDGVLYTAATLHEGAGTLQYSNEVDDMTLLLDNASINGGAGSPYIAYLAVWESNASGTLEIHLNYTPDGETARTEIYDLNAVFFESGLRTHIELNIEDDEISDIPDNVVAYDGYYYTADKIAPHVSDFIETSDGVFVPLYILDNVCPAGWHYFNQQTVPMTSTGRGNIFARFSPLFYGHLYGSPSQLYATNHIHIVNTDLGNFYSYHTNGALGYGTNPESTVRVRPICRRAI